MDIIYILGANGFIGRHLARFYEGDANVFPLSKADFDIVNAAHYTRYDFQHSLIIDCIARIDGHPGEIQASNVTGLKQFLEYLTEQQVTYSYLYFSTISTLDEHLAANHTYVASKFKAENLVRKYCPDHKIIRLSYPFGRGESPNRLISRLIHKALQYEEIIIADTSLQLTPVESLIKVIPEVINHPGKEINLIAEDSYTLEKIINYIYLKINQQPKFKLQKAAMVPAPLTDFYHVPPVRTVFETIDQLIEEITAHY